MTTGNFCPQHSAMEERTNTLLKSLADLNMLVRDHCNGGDQHVSRREMDDVRTHITGVKVRMDELKNQIEDIHKSRLSWYDRITVGLIVAAVTAALKYLG